MQSLLRVNRMIKLRIKPNNLNDLKSINRVSIGLNCDIDIGRGENFCDAKSLLGVMSMKLGEPMYLYINSTDEKLVELFKEWTVE